MKLIAQCGICKCVSNEVLSLVELPYGWRAVPIIYSNGKLYYWARSCVKVFACPKEIIAGDPKWN